MDTLAVQLCTSSLPTRTRDLHPLERAHGAQTKNRARSFDRALTKAFLFFRRTFILADGESVVNVKLKSSFAVIFISSPLNHASCILHSEKKPKKMQKKWVSKKSILFSLVDYVHNRKEPGRRIFLLIIRLVWPVPAWSGTLGSDAICRAPSGNPVQLRALPSQPIGCSKCSDLENEKIIFVFKKSDIFYMRPATWSNAI